MTQHGGRCQHHDRHQFVINKTGHVWAGGSRENNRAHRVSFRAQRSDLRAETKKRKQKGCFETVSEIVFGLLFKVISLFFCLFVLHLMCFSNTALFVLFLCITGRLKQHLMNQTLLMSDNRYRSIQTPELIINMNNIFYRDFLCSF